MTDSLGRHLRLLGGFARILSEAKGLPAIGDRVVRLVADHLEVPVCNFYVHDPDKGRLILLSTTSTRYRHEEVSLEMNEGLTGAVAQTMEPLNVANGPAHAYYRHFPELDEPGMIAYLGVPLVVRGRCNGVLVVRSRQEGPAPQEDELLLMTLASQLAGIVESARLLEILESRSPNAMGRLEKLAAHPEDVENAPPVEMSLFRGFPASPGLAMGKAHHIGRIRSREELVAIATPEGDQEEVFQKALDAALEDFRRTEAAAVDLVGQELSYIFGAQALLLHDPLFQGEIRTRIRNQRLPAHLAVYDAVEMLVGTMLKASSEYLRERAEDFQGVGTILVEAILGGEAAADDLVGNIAFAEQLSPAKLIDLASRKVSALVTAEGGTTSHVSLLARALNLPTITGVGPALRTIPEGSQVLVDGVVGNLFMEPTEAIRSAYDLTVKDASIVVGPDLALLGPCKLASGEEIRVMANVGLLRELPAAIARGADGVGLYRTEFTYLVHRNSPTEATQLRVYQRAFQEFPDRPITIRTLDLGGDKAAAFLGNQEHEDNPFMGLRSIRLSLAHPEVFRTQLRALFRASYGHKGRILFPMISSIEEMRETLRHVDLARAELRATGQPFAESLPLGAMIEVPAAVEIVSHLVKTVQFLSVGTNDLLQFTVAADRGNRKVAEIASKYHPALYSMLSRISWEAIRAGVPLSVCGEMAADPACALFLAGIQTDTLSMDSRYIERTKAILRTYTLEELRVVAGEVRKLGTATEIRRHLLRAMRLPPGYERLFEGVATI